MLKNKLLLSRDLHGVNILQLAAMTGNVETLDQLWGWAKELQLSTIQLNKLFLAVDRDGNTAIYRAACTGSIELLEEMWGV
jgi:ankyrin repeat protein